ncbi:hypothetical protein OG943_38690 [Amycolatopsis sp. NBC_00345]|uniref:hypothetical protein n=1 Tax=Amycolatopsis sp. NBC_00345 TaxID=2975955 RepID=UPI002E25506A
MNNSVNIVIGLVVLAWLLSRQVQKRLVREDRKPTVVLILGVLGVVSLAAFFKGGSPSGTAIALLAGSLLVAVLFGVVRAYTVRLWRADGQLWRQGTWLTVVLWIAAIAIHLGLDFVIDANSPVKGLGNASILLYLAVTLGAQRLVVQQRANRQPQTV